ncbi:hypothetical protein RISK_002013 [Rhodopirellula islandica]|uniref:Uncharacterized protein n=1 Tax=Rhodopirellula islandica TaxID=595434 RepID=A0A0J1BI01_RHOIS|nr:hypothetical protein RISK_002013 [Rhodopirellula islandica]
MENSTERTQENSTTRDAADSDSEATRSAGQSSSLLGAIGWQISRRRCPRRRPRSG